MIILLLESFHLWLLSAPWNLDIFHFLFALISFLFAVLLTIFYFNIRKYLKVIDVVIDTRSLSNTDERRKKKILPFQIVIYSLLSFIVISITWPLDVLRSHFIHKIRKYIRFHRHLIYRLLFHISLFFIECECRKIRWNKMNCDESVKWNVRLNCVNQKMFTPYETAFFRGDKGYF